MIGNRPLTQEEAFDIFKRMETGASYGDIVEAYKQYVNEDEVLFLLKGCIYEGYRKRYSANKNGGAPLPFNPMSMPDSFTRKKPQPIIEPEPIRKPVRKPVPKPVVESAAPPEDEAVAEPDPSPPIVAHDDPSFPTPQERKSNRITDETVYEMLDLRYRQGVKPGKIGLRLGITNVYVSQILNGRTRLKAFRKFDEDNPGVIPLNIKEKLEEKSSLPSVVKADWFE